MELNDFIFIRCKTKMAEFICGQDLIDNSWCICTSIWIYYVFMRDIYQDIKDIENVHLIFQSHILVHSRRVTSQTCFHLNTMLA